MAFQIFGKMSLDGAGFQAGLAKAKSGAQKLKKSIGKAFSGMGAAIVGAFAVAAITSKIKETIEWAARIRDVAKVFGMTTEHIQKLEYAATQSGVAIEDVMDAHKDLGKSTGEALAGVEGKIWAFRALGITVDEIKGKNIDQVFMRVARAIREGGDILTPDQAKAIEDLGGGAMFKLINMMRSDLPGLFKQMEEGFGLVADADIQALGRISDGMADFKTQSTGIWAGMIGTMYQAFFKFSDYVISAVDYMAERFYAMFANVKRMAGGVSSFMSAVAGGDLGAIKAAIKEMQKGSMGLVGEGMKMMGAPGAAFTMAAQRGEERKKIAAQRGEADKGKEGEAAALAILQERVKIADKLTALDEESEKRRFDELSTAQKLLHLEMQLALERAKLAKLPALHTADEISTAAEKLGGIKGAEKAKAMEAANLEREEQKKTILGLEDKTAAAKTAAQKTAEAEKTAGVLPLAGEAKFSALARIGGARGGRNPVLDLAKRQFLLQQTQAETAQQMAGSLSTIAGT